MERELLYALVEVVVETYQCETPIHETTQEVINYVLEDDYELNYYQYPDPQNKPSDRGQYTDQNIYIKGWSWNIIDHNRAVIYKKSQRN